MTQNEYAGVLPDNGEPWPRQFACYGYANKEIREDAAAEASEWWLIGFQRCLEEAAVRLADGETWHMTWAEITQIEVDIENSCRENEGLDHTWMRAGDWRYRAVAKVMPL